MIEQLTAVAPRDDEPEDEPLEKQAPDTPPEQRLWLAVLNQALADATITDDNIASVYRSRRLDLQKQRRISRAWLCRRSADLDTVCQHAGINPDSFIIFARGIRADGWRNAA